MKRPDTQERILRIAKKEFLQKVLKALRFSRSSLRPALRRALFTVTIRIKPRFSTTSFPPPPRGFGNASKRRSRPISS